MSIKSIKVPDIGDFQDIPVIEILVKVGDLIDIDTSLCTLESDKATMEVPSPIAGVVAEILINIGDKVSQGSEIVKVDSSDKSINLEKNKESPSAKSPNTESSKPEPVKTSSINTKQSDTHDQSLDTLNNATKDQITSSSPSPTSKPHATPSVRKLARELGVDLALVSASGRKGRILPQDVNNFVKNIVSGEQQARVPAGNLNLLDWPKIDFSKFGEVETKPLSRIKKISGANLHRNWVMIPHITQHDEADITSLEDFRKSLVNDPQNKGIRITILAFIIKAIVTGLKKHPEFNASIDGDNLILKKYFNIGVAVDTPEGLVVPVLKDCDQKGIIAISKDLTSISELARNGKLKPTDIQGGCFTISSLGGIGGHYFTPIINAPEVAILGVSRNRNQYIPDNNGNLVTKLYLPLSLSYDHRVIDGATGARFITTIKECLTDMRQTLIL